MVLPVPGKSLEHPVPGHKVSSIRSEKSLTLPGHKVSSTRAEKSLTLPRPISHNRVRGSCFFMASRRSSMICCVRSRTPSVLRWLSICQK